MRTRMHASLKIRGLTAGLIRMPAASEQWTYTHEDEPRDGHVEDATVFGQLQRQTGNVDAKNGLRC